MRPSTGTECRDLSQSGRFFDVFCPLVSSSPFAFRDLATRLRRAPDFVIILCPIAREHGKDNGAPRAVCLFTSA